MAPKKRNHNGHLIPFAILFVAVLLAYRQRGTAADAVKHAADAASDIPSGSDSTPTTTYTTPYPYALPTRVGPPVGRQLPVHVFAFLSRLPSYLLPIITYPFYVARIALPYLLYPLRILLQLVLTILSPFILLIQETYRILILIPVETTLSIGRALYPFYLFGAVAILFGAIVGSCGGALHKALVTNAINPVGDELKSEVHAGLVRVVDGKAGVRKSERRRVSPKEYLDPVKQEDLRDWRETVW